MRARDLFTLASRLADDASARESIDSWARSATPREVLAAGSEARLSFSRGIWGATFVSLNRPINTTHIVGLPAGALALLTLHRSGYLREVALEHLTTEGPWALPFFLLRCDDIVYSVRARATETVTTRFVDSHAVAFMRALRIVATLRMRARGGGGPLVKAIESFLVGHAEALALGDDDPVVRHEAFRLRLRSEPPTLVLCCALVDPDLRVRIWAARSTLRLASAEDKRSLLPLLEASRSAATRRLAVCGRDQLGDDPAIEDALLDVHAAVRLEARLRLRARQPERPFGQARTRALSTLSSGATLPKQLIGALGALSDVGTHADVAVVESFLEHPIRRVREEAARTHATLSVEARERPRA
ncbi:MAG: hypothetical protein JNK04_10965 [Myxococcales bacterium]|nr:hypothetical protein [Myxococcales bacterium]